jgi:hypothetical protein
VGGVLHGHCFSYARRIVQRESRGACDHAYLLFTQPVHTTCSHNLQELATPLMHAAANGHLAVSHAMLSCHNHFTALCHLT